VHSSGSPAAVNVSLHHTGVYQRHIHERLLITVASSARQRPWRRPPRFQGPRSRRSLPHLIPGVRSACDISALPRSTEGAWPHPHVKPTRTEPTLSQHHGHRRHADSVRAGRRGMTEAPHQILDRGTGRGRQGLAGVMRRDCNSPGRWPGRARLCSFPRLLNSCTCLFLWRTSEVITMDSQPSRHSVSVARIITDRPPAVRQHDGVPLL
jgi:hypothetical protein